MLTLGRSFYTEMFFYALSDCASLRKLSMTDATLGSGGPQEVQLRHEGLRSLHMIKCRVLRIAIRLYFIHYNHSYHPVVDGLHFNCNL